MAADGCWLELLEAYLLRSPVRLSRIHWTPGSKTLFYESKASHDDPFYSHPQGETLDIFEFVARVVTDAGTATSPGSTHNIPHREARFQRVRAAKRQARRRATGRSSSGCERARRESVL